MDQSIALGDLREDYTGTAPAQALRPELSIVCISLFIQGRIYWACPPPPFERVARGGRAPAAGLCARPGNLRGPLNRIVGGPGSGPKSSPQAASFGQGFSHPIFCSATLGEG